MPQAGERIKALDFPPKVTARVPDTFSNFTTTGFEPTPTPCEITFTVGTDGDGELWMFLRWNPDTNGERANADVELRENNSSGTLIHSPDETTGGISNYAPDSASSGDNYVGWRDLAEFGLTPGGTYWARLLIEVTGGSTLDIFDQRLTFKPA